MKSETGVTKPSQEGKGAPQKQHYDANERKANHAGEAQKSNNTS